MVGISPRTAQRMFDLDFNVKDGDIIQAHEWCSDVIAATNPVKSIDCVLPETVVLNISEWANYEYCYEYRTKLICVKSKLDFEFIVDSSIKDDSSGRALFKRIADSDCDELWYEGDHYTCEEFINEVFGGDITAQRVKQKYKYWTDSLWEICVQLSLYDDPEEPYYDGSLLKMFKSRYDRTPLKWSWS